MDKLKQTQNFFEKLIKDEKSVFYAANRISRLLLGKPKISLYERINLLSSKYFTLHLLNIERTLIGRLLYTVSKPLSNLCMLIWLIFNLFPKWQQVAKNERMRMQTDLEFQQNEIKTLNKKYNVEIFSSVQNRKLESLRGFYSKAKKHTRQLPLALDSIQKG